MPATSVITVHVNAETNDKLRRLANATGRSLSHLAAEAISTYVARELEIIEGIQRGLDDVRAGRVVPHEEAMAEAYAIIETAKFRKT
jgi:predicted transcriptional regulator